MEVGGDEMWHNTDYIIQMNKKKRPSFGFMLLKLFFISVLIFGMNLILQTNPISETLSHFIKMPKLFFLNWLPVLVLLILLLALSGELHVSALGTFLLFFSLSLANRMKIEARNEPLFFSDFQVMKEAGLVVFQSSPLRVVILSLVVTTFLLSVLLFFKKKNRNRSESSVSALPRVLLAAGSITAAVFLRPLYTNKDLRFTDKETVEYSDSVIYYNRFGFIYRFIASSGSYSDVYRPPFYDEEKIETLETAGENNRKKLIEKWNEEDKADIIFILSESFCDIPDLPFFQYKNDGYPLVNYRRIKEEALINGYIDVSGFGGGTANTEFDILTACCSNSVDTESLYPYRAIRRDISSVPRLLRRIGYKTNAIQPMQDWYYNVGTVYRHFGFEQSRFLKDFQGKSLRGGYMNEKDTIQRVIDDYEAHIRTNDRKTPIFNYCVTIQNHAYYKYSKYPDETVPVLFDKKWLTSKGVESLATYFHGLRDVDRELGRLVDYLKKVDRPVILVYYGDHLPHLPPEPDVLKNIGYLSSDKDLKKYRPPFFIWANERGKEKVLRKKPKLPADRVISSSYLSPLVLEMLGYDGISNFMDFVNELRKKGAYPVIRPETTRRLYRDQKKYRFENPSELTSDELDFMTYVAWQYHILQTAYREK